jgi:PAS domain S-box-containing protein
MPPGVISLLLVLGPFAWALWLHRRLKAQDQALQAAAERSREADRRADASALQFSALSGSLPQALWVVGPDGSTRHLNRRWAEYTGLSDDECQGHGWLKTVYAEDQQRYLAARDVALSAGTACSIEVRLRRHDGVFRWWLVRVVPARNAAGQIVEWIGSCTDIEDLKQAEDSVRRSEDRYRQILAFSRHQPAERRLCELQPIVEESLRLLRSTLPAQVRIELRGAADLPRVLADPLQIEQVVLNLCTNAAYAMEGSGGLIDLQLDRVQLGAQEDPDRPDLPPGRYLRLRCSDNGRGMEAQTLQRIFEPFFTTKPVGIGTGLGLSVAHGILAAHDGAITARSEPGRGSCFTLYLPVAVTASGGESRAPVGDGSPAPAPSRDGSRVLYVDDEEALVFLVRRLLERRGHAVSVFTDPEAAMAAFRAAPDAFDVVVTDFNMPKLSGLDVARIVRELRPDVPIAIASGYVTEELRGQAGPAGVGTLIYKEDLVDRFCDSIEQMIRSRAVPR